MVILVSGMGKGRKGGGRWDEQEGKRRRRQGGSKFSAESLDFEVEKRSKVVHWEPRGNKCGWGLNRALTVEKRLCGALELGKQSGGVWLA